MLSLIHACITNKNKKTETSLFLISLSLLEYLDIVTLVKSERNWSWRDEPARPCEQGPPPLPSQQFCVGPMTVARVYDRQQASLNEALAVL